METRPPIRESIVAIVSGRPMILLAVALVPIFLHHHYFSISASGVNGYRGLSLTRWNPIVSTRRLVPVRAIESDLPHPTQQGSSGLGKIMEYKEWDSWTAKFSGGANIPFLMLQLPQIILNAQNLLAGNNTALSAVPWLVKSHL